MSGHVAGVTAERPIRENASQNAQAREANKSDGIWDEAERSESRPE
jgi:hypothetical protein